VLFETPYYTTMDFHFDGNSVALASEYNVGFGSTEVPTLTGSVK
jgi:hypothetical protein